MTAPLAGWSPWLMALALSQIPARDVAPAASASPGPAGTGSIVLAVRARDGQTVEPLRRATVQLSNSLLGIQQTVLTDDNGMATFNGLPAARYLVEASKAPFVRMPYGARRHDMPGTPIAVGDGQRVEGLTIELPRGAVIAGTLRDPTGRPMPGRIVSLVESRLVDGVRRLVTPTSVRVAGGLPSIETNDAGELRLYGLPAGEYSLRTIAVNPSPAGVVPAPRTAPIYGYTHVYYPGTSDSSAAETIRISAGEERSGVDLQVVYAPSANLGGIVTLPGGQPAANVRVVLVPDGPFGNGVMTNAEGRFSMTGVPAGQYTIRARSIPRAPSPVRDDGGPAMWGQAVLTMTGQHMTDFGVTLQPSMSAHGKVVLDSAGERTLNLAGIEVTLTPPSLVTNISYALRLPSKTDAVGVFNTSGLTPGMYTVQVSVPRSIDPGGAWTVASAMAGGRDLLDLPIEVGPQGDLPELVVTLTEKAQTVSGVLSDKSGGHPPGFAIVAFASDSRFWTPASRRVRVVHPATDGHFSLTLPAGAYRIAAVSNLGPDDASDPTFLRQLVPASLEVPLAPSERRTLNLVISE